MPSNRLFQTRPLLLAVAAILVFAGCQSTQDEQETGTTSDVIATPSQEDAASQGVGNTPAPVAQDNGTPATGAATAHGASPAQTTDTAASSAQAKAAGTSWFEIGDEAGETGLYAGQLAAVSPTELRIALVSQEASAPVVDKASATVEVLGQSAAPLTAERDASNAYLSVKLPQPIQFPARTSMTLTIQGHYRPEVITSELAGISQLD